MIVDEYNVKSTDEIVQSIPDDLKKVAPIQKRNKMFWVILIVAIFGVLISGFRLQRMFSHFESATSNNSINSWLSSFMNKDYDNCDNFVSNSNFKISSYFVSFYDDNVNSLYEETLDKLVDCISSVRVIDCENDKYSIEVTYKPYKTTSSFKVDELKYKTISENYKNGLISDSELQEQLNELYAEIYLNSCFEISKEEKTSVFYLSEVNAKVEDTVSFIENLLEASNIFTNLEFYQNNVKSEIEELEN